MDPHQKNGRISLGKLGVLFPVSFRGHVSRHIGFKFIRSMLVKMG
jgi:hypothetical protein